MDFTGKIALVTGATSGMGREMALTLLRRGANVIINYIVPEQRADMEESVAEFGERAVFLKADITQENEVKEMFGQVAVRFGKLDFLCNIAGINFLGYMETQDMDGARRVIDINMISKLITIKYAVPLLRKAGGGAIVNTASRLAVRPVAGASAYAACEAGIIMLTKTAALELAKDRIRVNAICPGRTVTPEVAHNNPPQDVVEYVKSAPLGRVGYTTDVANAILFLLSDEAENITGEDLHVNGGILLV